MVVYEVSAIVESHLCESFERYMTGRHIADVMATGAFDAASFEISAPGKYRTRYMAASQAALDTYLERHAASLRSDFAEHFPNGIEVSRTQLAVLASVP